MNKLIKIYQKQRKSLVNINLFFIVFLVGITLNFNVIINNNGKMPVLSPYNWETRTHFTINETNIKEVSYLGYSDVFNIGVYYFSIGDVFLLIGEIIIIANYFVFLYLLIIERRVLKKWKNKI